MSEIPFDRTVRGARFFDHHVPRALELLPKLIKELERFNDNMERFHELIVPRRDEDPR